MEFLVNFSISMIWVSTTWFLLSVISFFVLSVIYLLCKDDCNNNMAEILKRWVIASLIICFFSICLFAYSRAFYYTFRDAIVIIESSPVVDTIKTKQIKKDNYLECIKAVPDGASSSAVEQLVDACRKLLY